MRTENVQLHTFIARGMRLTNISCSGRRWYSFKIVVDVQETSDMNVSAACEKIYEVVMQSS